MIKPSIVLMNPTFSLNPSILPSITMSQPKYIQIDPQSIKKSFQPKRNKRIKECGSTTGHCWFHKHTRRMEVCFDNFIIYSLILMKYQKIWISNTSAIYEKQNIWKTEYLKSIRSRISDNGLNDWKILITISFIAVLWPSCESDDSRRHCILLLACIFCLFDLELLNSRNAQSVELDLVI